MSAVIKARLLIFKTCLLSTVRSLNESAFERTRTVIVWVKPKVRHCLLKWFHHVLNCFALCWKKCKLQERFGRKLGLFQAPQILKKPSVINVEVGISGKEKLYLLCSKEESEVGSCVWGINSQLCSLKIKLGNCKISRQGLLYNAKVWQGFSRHMNFINFVN